MRKSQLAALILTALVWMTAGCASGASGSAQSGGTGVASSVAKTSQWPQNEYTNAVVEPSAGSIDYVLDDRENGRYSVVYSDISREDSEAYIAELEELGYTEVEATREEASMGVLMKKGNTTLSISASDGILGISISQG